MAMSKQYGDAELKKLWREFGDVLIDYTEDYPDGVIVNNWFIFDVGAERMDIWHWFDDNYSGGVYKLMFPNA